MILSVELSNKLGLRLFEKLKIFLADKRKDMK